MVNIDNTDIKIILTMYSLPENGIFKITKSLFSEVLTTRLAINKYNFVMVRIKKLCEYGLIKYTYLKNGDKKYYLLEDSCNIKKFKILDKLKKCLMLKIENKWVIFEL